MDILDSWSLSYQREFPVGKYNIDFALSNMIALEIDGRHHEDEAIKEKDKRKDAFLQGLGWTVVRVKWVNDKEKIQRLRLALSPYIGALDENRTHVSNVPS